MHRPVKHPQAFFRTCSLQYKLVLLQELLWMSAQRDTDYVATSCDTRKNNLTWKEIMQKHLLLYLSTNMHHQRCLDSICPVQISWRLRTRLCKQVRKWKHHGRTEHVAKEACSLLSYLSFLQCRWLLVCSSADFQVPSKMQRSTFPGDLHLDKTLEAKNAVRSDSVDSFSPPFQKDCSCRAIWGVWNTQPFTRSGLNHPANSFLALKEQIKDVISSYCNTPIYGVELLNPENPTDQSKQICNPEYSVCRKKENEWFTRWDHMWDFKKW